MRAVIVEDERLLLVNAWPGTDSDLWCAPGGGVEVGTSMPDNLAREVREELGITVDVGPPCLVNEFHSPRSQFHQVEIFFRCSIRSGRPTADWTDPEGIVNRWIWASQREMTALHVKPNTLRHMPWQASSAPSYDPLEQIVR